MKLSSIVWLFGILPAVKLNVLLGTIVILKLRGQGQGQGQGQSG